MQSTESEFKVGDVVTIIKEEFKPMKDLVGKLGVVTITTSPYYGDGYCIEVKLLESKREIRYRRDQLIINNSGLAGAIYGNVGTNNKK